MPTPLSRRDAFKSAAGLAVAALHGRAFAQAPHNPITEENARPGTRDWMLQTTRIDPETKYRCRDIEGYCSAASVRAGETLRFFVSTNPASEFTIEIYRMGYYGGEGGRFMKKLGPFAGKTQADPEIGPKRLRNCAWEAAAELAIPADWVSGVYVGKLTAAEGGWQSYVIFIVRDERRADLLFQCSDHTWHAYNRWPQNFALYDDGYNNWYWGGGVQVSFNRPYGKYCQILDAPLSTGSGEWFLWEFPFAYWLESLGYDVSYISNTDTHADAAGLLRGRGFLSVGHDEYWTGEMYANVRAAIDAGVSAGFFSGNAVWGRVLYDPAVRGFERIGVFGPPGGTREFTMVSSLEHTPPYGNTLMGAQSTGPVTGGADWVCTAPEHWVYAGTGMKAGEAIPGVMGGNGTAIQRPSPASR